MEESPHLGYTYGLKTAGSVDATHRSRASTGDAFSRVGDVSAGVEDTRTNYYGESQTLPIVVNTQVNLRSFNMEKT